MRDINFNKINRIHFVGIGGIGLSAIAKLMLAKGKSVTGSDINKSEITDELKKTGVKIFIGQNAKNVTDDVELVIYTMAISKDNPELAKAVKSKIPILAYPEALGIFFNDKFGIAICGTHGKSTTTSMVGLILAKSGFDPSVVVGSKVPDFGGNLRVGEGKCMVIEACEYERAFLNYYPKIILINNIELDHTDYYRNVDDFRSAFEEFVGHLPEDGVLIANGDDEQIQNAKIKIKNDNSKLKIINFGFNTNNDVIGSDVVVSAGQTKFKVIYRKKDLGEFILKVPGRFNVYNALGAITVALQLNIDPQVIKKTLADFGGIWRRFEMKGKYKEALVVSDYAHHPTAVKATIKAAKEFYPGKRIVAVFQPHQHNRTKELYKDFLQSFDGADLVILSEIFDVAGREEKKDQDVNSRNLSEDMKERIKGNESISLKPDCVFYVKDLNETRKLIDEKLKPGDIMIIMGAGDIYKVADSLVK